METGDSSEAPIRYAKSIVGVPSVLSGAAGLYCNALGRLAKLGGLKWKCNT
jgi:hypothetical protein